MQDNLDFTFNSNVPLSEGTPFQAPVSTPISVPSASSINTVPNLKSNPELDSIKYDITQKFDNAYSDLYSSSLSSVSNFSNLGRDTRAPKYTDYLSFDSMYDTLKDGSVIPRFKNVYNPSTDEDRLAQQQTTGEKWWNGIQKAAVNMGSTFFRNTYGVPYSIAQVVKEGEFSAYWDNAMSDYLDDVTKRLSLELPNYYREEDKQRNFFGQLSTANFWADKALNGISFTVGTLASEAAWMFLTGGGSVFAEGASLAGKGLSAIRGVGRTAGVAEDAVMLGSKMRAMSNTAILSNIKNSSNIVRSVWTSASMEAALEAKSMYNEALDDYLSNFQKQNGRVPTQEELSEFDRDAKNTANWVFSANVPLVAASNIIQFGSLMGIKTGIGETLSKPFNKMMGLEVAQGVGTGVKQLTKATSLGKALGYTVPVLKPMVTEGFVEEGGQKVFSEAGKAYLDSRYNHEATDKNLSFIQSAYEGFKSAYGTKEGLEEVGLGALIGLISGGAAGRTESGKWNAFGIRDYSENLKSAQRAVDTINSSSENITDNHFRILMEKMMLANQHNVAMDNATKAFRNGKIGEANKFLMDADFTQLYHNYEVSGLDVDFNQDMSEKIDAMDNEELSKEWGVDTGEVENRKAQLKENIARQTDSYKKAMRMVKGTLNLGGTKLRQGHIVEQAMAHSLYSARESYNRLQDYGQALENALSINGYASAKRLYENLNKDVVSKAQDLSNLETELENKKNRLNEINLSPVFNSVPELDKDGNVKQTDEKNKLIIERDSLLNDINDLTNQISQGESILDKLIPNKTKFKSGGILSDDLKDLNSLKYRDIKNALDRIGQFNSNLEQMQKDPEFKGQVKTLDYLLNEYAKGLTDIDNFLNFYDRMSSDKNRKNFLSRYLNRSNKGNELNNLDNTSKLDKLAFDETINNVSGLKELYDKTDEDGKFFIETLANVYRRNLIERRTAGTRLGANRAYTSTIIDDNGNEVISVTDTFIDVYKDDQMSDEEWSDYVKSQKVPTGAIELIDEETGEKSPGYIIKDLADDIRLSPREQAIYEDNKEDIDSKVEAYKASTKTQDEISDSVWREKSKWDRKQAVKNEGWQLKNKITNKLLNIPQLIEQNYIQGGVDNYVSSVEDALGQLDRYTELYNKSDKTSDDFNEMSELENKLTILGDALGTITEEDSTLLDDVLNYLQYQDTSNKTIFDEQISTIDTDDIEMASDEFDEVDDRGNKNITQVYEKAFVSKKGNNYAIANITPSAFIEEFSNSNNVTVTGVFDQNLEPVSISDINNIKNLDGFLITYNTPEGAKELSFTLNNQRNILIDENDKSQLETDTSFKFKVTTLTTKWQPLLVERSYGDMTTLEVMNSDFTNESNESMSVVGIRNVNVGDTLSATVELKSDYNSKLINDFVKIYNKYNAEFSKNAGKVSDSTAQLLSNAKLRLSNQLNISLVDSEGRWVSTLKSSNESLTTNDPHEMALHVARRDFVDNIIGLIHDNLLEGVNKLNQPNLATVQFVFPGHAKMNFVLNDDNSVSVQNQDLTSEDLDNISDFGYVQGNNVRLNSGSKVSLDNQPYISAILKNSKDKKIPVVLLNFNNKSILFPVSMKDSGINFLDMFDDVLNQTAPLPTGERLRALNEVIRLSGLPKNSWITYDTLNNDSLLEGVRNKLLPLNEVINVDSLLNEGFTKNDLINSVETSTPLNSDSFYSQKFKIILSGEEVIVPVKSGSAESNEIIYDETLDSENEVVSEMTDNERADEIIPNRNESLSTLLNRTVDASYLKARYKGVKGYMNKKEFISLYKRLYNHYRSSGQGVENAMSMSELTERVLFSMGQRLENLTPYQLLMGENPLVNIDKNGRVSLSNQETISDTDIMNQVISMLSTSFDGVEFLSDEQAEKILRENKNAQHLSSINDVSGFVVDNKMYFNKSKFDINTPIHEFGHLWLFHAKVNNPELYKQGLDKVRNSKYYQQVMTNSNYVHIHSNEELVLQESLAHAIGDEGEAFVNAIDRATFKEWLNKLWTYISNTLGIRDMTIDQVKALTLNEYARGVAQDLIKNSDFGNVVKAEDASQISGSFSFSNLFSSKDDKLVVTHSLSYDKLKNLKNLNYEIPSASLAIHRIKNIEATSGFGDIMVLFDKSILDKNASIYDQDFYSPVSRGRHPQLILNQNAYTASANEVLNNLSEDLRDKYASSLDEYYNDSTDVNNKFIISKNNRILQFKYLSEVENIDLKNTDENDITVKLLNILNTKSYNDFIESQKKLYLRNVFINRKGEFTDYNSKNINDDMIDELDELEKEPVTNAKRLKDLKDISKNRKKLSEPYSYFEAKLKEVVHLKDASIIAIPNEVSNLIEPILKDAGVKNIVFYNSTEIGDKSRIVDENAKIISFKLNNDESTPTTLSVLENKTFKAMEGKTINPVTIKNGLNSQGIKQIEKDIINDVLSQEQFQGQKKINYDDFKEAVQSQIMPLDKVESDSYANYGSLNSDYDKQYTLIYNSPLNHGVTGHFRSDYYKGSKNENDEVIFNIPTKGLYGHTRIWTKDDVYNVAELQSDVFQKEDLDDLFQPRVDLQLTYIDEYFKNNRGEYQKNFEKVNNLTGEIEGVFGESDYKKSLLSKINNASNEDSIIDNYRNSVKTLQNDAKNAYKLNEDISKKQFRASEKSFELRLIRESIKDAAEKGYDKLRLPLPHTISKIEGYLGESSQIQIEGSEPVLGENVDFLGSSYTIVDSDGFGTATVVPSNSVNYEHLDYVFDTYFEDILQNLNSSLEEYGRAQNIEEITNNIGDVRGLSEIEEYLNNNYGDSEEINIDDITDEIKTIILDNTSNSDLVAYWENAGFEHVFIENNSLYTSSDIGESVTYSSDDTSKEDFSIDDLSDSHKPIARRYEAFGKMLQKERGKENFKIVEDEDGYDWYETKITQEDRENPLIAFKLQESNTEDIVESPQPISNSDSVIFANDALTNPNVTSPIKDLGISFFELGLLSQKEIESVENAFGVDRSNTIEFGEALGRGFEKYIIDEVVDSRYSLLKSVFDKFKNWLVSLYEGTNYFDGITLTPQVKVLYARLLGDSQSMPSIDFNSVDNSDISNVNISLGGIIGNSGIIEFSDKLKQPFQYRVIENTSLIPSHSNDGLTRNPKHKELSKAQPKNRDDFFSEQSRQTIAKNPEFSKLGESTNAYSGAPVVNGRGQVIQGNNRSMGINKHYSPRNTYQTSYREQLLQDAEKFGFTRESIEKFKNPVLVRMVDVSDTKAIELGQKTFEDLETGGTRAFDASRVFNSMSYNDKQRFFSKLFGSDNESDTLSESIKNNAVDIMRVIDKHLTAQNKNAVWASPNVLTKETRDSIENLVNQMLFVGNTNVQTQFNSLDETVKNGILKSLSPILSVSPELSLLPQVQSAIEIAYLYKLDKSNGAVNTFGAWSINPRIFDRYDSTGNIIQTTSEPISKYSMVSLDIAELFSSAKRQKDIVDLFKTYANSASLDNDNMGSLFEDPSLQPFKTKEDGFMKMFEAEYSYLDERLDRNFNRALGVDSQINNLNTPMSLNDDESTNNIIEINDLLLKSANNKLEEKC